MFFFLFAELGNSYVKEKNWKLVIYTVFLREKKKSQIKLLYLDTLEGERDNIA